MATYREAIFDIRGRLLCGAISYEAARGEAPIASHLLYTQPGVLRDEVQEERVMGIAAGLAWREVADAWIFYLDLGWSPGMRSAREVAEREGRPIVLRILGEWA